MVARSLVGFPLTFYAYPKRGLICSVSVSRAAKLIETNDLVKCTKYPFAGMQCSSDPGKAGQPNYPNVLYKI